MSINILDGMKLRTIVYLGNISGTDQLYKCCRVK